MATHHERAKFRQKAEQSERYARSSALPRYKASRLAAFADECATAATLAAMPIVTKGRSRASKMARLQNNLKALVGTEVG